MGKNKFAAIVALSCVLAIGSVAAACGFGGKGRENGSSNESERVSLSGQESVFIPRESVSDGFPDRETDYESAGEPTEESTFDVEPDTVAPVLSIAGEKTFTVEPGEELLLPVATAVDDRDGDVSGDIVIATEPAEYASIADGRFLSDVLGCYAVFYSVKDAAGNETSERIEVNVISERYAETFDVSGFDDISALGKPAKGERAVYKENFAAGGDSPLISSAKLPAYVKPEAGVRAISGNSLVIDYGKCAGGANEWIADGLSPYLKSGRWEVSFDVKLISGTGFSDFYFCYRKIGEGSSFERQVSLAEMREGETKHVSYSRILDFDDGAWQFCVLKRNRNGDAVLALDNFTFAYTNINFKTTYPTEEELKAGYTYDWTKNYTPISSAEPVLLDEVENNEAKSAMEASEGFGKTLMHLTGSGGHEITSLSKTFSPDFFRKGYVYTFELWYYAVTPGTNYLIATDGTPANHMIKQGVFKEGLQKATIEYTVAENDVGITFFTGNAVDIYLGNMTITLKEPAGNLVMPAGTCVCDAGENQSGTLTRREVFRFKR